jgi:hypothetical protein
MKQRRPNQSSSTSENIVAASSEQIARKPTSIEALSLYVQSLGLTRTNEAIRMIREDRDR